METVTFELNGEFIELCNLLKLAGIANSGGQGKLMVSDGIVQVDGNIETRRTAKIRAGQVVECMGQLIKVV
jgi:ribosome-associated protein